MEMNPIRDYNWVSFLAYPNLFGTKGLVVVVYYPTSKNYKDKYALCNLFSNWEILSFLPRKNSKFTIWHMQPNLKHSIQALISNISEAI